ncbi:MAG: peptide-methionine (S)-S-oxide reductase MsrA [Campylobacterota bacterium]|nr:peptide-methionine (S)-S-oxide reductase MsrA [Campylobacterota bacterium]
MNKKRLVLGGGCFWCTEAVFRNVKGVDSVVSGYTGGHRPNPTYENICTGVSGHAEIVDIEYDAEIISLENLLEIFFIIHDPTTLNAQGADKGTQYRSVIYYEDKDEKNIIENAIKKAQHKFNNKIVTEVTQIEDVYPAEDYHQNYYNLNSSQGYCQVIIAPKLKKFMMKFPERLA